MSLKIASSTDISVLFLSMSCKCCMPRSGKTRVPHTLKAQGEKKGCVLVLGNSYFMGGDDLININYDLFLDQNLYFVHSFQMWVCSKQIIKQVQVLDYIMSSAIRNVCNHISIIRIYSTINSCDVRGSLQCRILNSG